MPIAFAFGLFIRRLVSIDDQASLVGGEKAKTVTLVDRVHSERGLKLTTGNTRPERSNFYTFYRGRCLFCLYTFTHLRCFFFFCPALPAMAGLPFFLSLLFLSVGAASRVYPCCCPCKHVPSVHSYHLTIAACML